MTGNCFYFCFGTHGVIGRDLLASVFDLGFNKRGQLGVSLIWVGLTRNTCVQFFFYLFIYLFVNNKYV